MRAAVELSAGVPQIETCWQAAIDAAAGATRPALVRAGVPDDDSPCGARAISTALGSMTERYFYRASKNRTSLTDAAQTLTHIWLAMLPS
jgi:TetR/AcrR family transcriptional regulator, ethionamide resistance regulator